MVGEWRLLVLHHIMTNSKKPICLTLTKYRLLYCISKVVYPVFQKVNHILCGEKYAMFVHND